MHEGTIRRVQGRSAPWRPTSNWHSTPATDSRPLAVRRQQAIPQYRQEGGKAAEHTTKGRSDIVAYESIVLAYPRRRGSRNGGRCVEHGSLAPAGKVCGMLAVSAQRSLREKAEELVAPRLSLRRLACKRQAGRLCCLRRAGEGCGPMAEHKNGRGPCGARPGAAVNWARFLSSAPQACALQHVQGRAVLPRRRPHISLRGSRGPEG